MRTRGILLRAAVVAGLGVLGLATPRRGEALGSCYFCTSSTCSAVSGNCMTLCQAKGATCRGAPYSCEACGTCSQTVVFCGYT